MSQKRPIGFIIIAIANFVVATCFIVCGVCEYLRFKLVRRDQRRPLGR